MASQQWRLDALAILRRNIGEAERALPSMVESQNWWGTTVLDCQAIGLGAELVMPFLTEIMRDGVEYHAMKASARFEDMANEAAEARLVQPAHAPQHPVESPGYGRGMFDADAS